MKYETKNFAAIDLAYSTKIGASDAQKIQCLKIYKQDSLKALKNYSSIEDIHYGDDEDQIFDLIFPNNFNPNNKHPLLISIHGGYWQKQTHKDGTSMSEIFLNQGFVVAGIHYRLCPKVSLSDLTKDTHLAINHLLNHKEKFGIDRDQIYLIGHSAGAHLSMCALSQFELAGAILVSGIYDLTPIQFTNLNANIQLKEDEIKNLSYPNQSLKNKKANLLVCFGALESSEFELQSQNITRHYEKLGANVVYRAYENLHHFDIMNEINNPQSEIYKDIHQLLLKN